METGKATIESGHSVNIGTDASSHEATSTASKSDTLNFQVKLLQAFEAEAQSSASGQESTVIQAEISEAFSAGDMLGELMHKFGPDTLIDTLVQSENPDGTLVDVDSRSHHEASGRSTHSSLHIRMGEFGTDALLQESVADDTRKTVVASQIQEPVGLEAEAMDLGVPIDQVVDSANEMAAVDDRHDVIEDFDQPDNDAIDEDDDESVGESDESRESEREIVSYDRVDGEGERQHSGERGESQRDSQEQQQEDDDKDDDIKVVNLSGEAIVDSVGVGLGGMQEIFAVQPDNPEVFKDILMRLEGESKQLSGLTLAEAIYQIGGKLSRSEVYIDPSATVETVTLAEWVPSSGKELSPIQEKLIGLADVYGDNSTIGEMFDQKLLSSSDMISLHSELRVTTIDAKSRTA